MMEPSDVRSSTRARSSTTGGCSSSEFGDVTGTGGVRPPKQAVSSAHQRVTKRHVINRFIVNSGLAVTNGGTVSGVMPDRKARLSAAPQRTAGYADDPPSFAGDRLDAIDAEAWSRKPRQQQLEAPLKAASHPQRKGRIGRELERDAVGRDDANRGRLDHPPVVAHHEVWVRPVEPKGERGWALGQAIAGGRVERHAGPGAREVRVPLARHGDGQDGAASQHARRRQLPRLVSPVAPTGVDVSDADAPRAGRTGRVAAAVGVTDKARLVAEARWPLQCGSDIQQ